MAPGKDVHKGAYPRYNDGDVEIIVTPLDRLRLHRHILRMSSTKLSQELDSPGAKLSRAAMDAGVTVRWRLHYRQHPDGDYFENVPLNQSGEPLVKTSIGLTNYNGRMVPPSIKAILMLFKAFYHRDMDIDRCNMATILTDIHNLLDVAQKMGSVSTVRYTVENALLSEGPTLWEAVARSPHIWIVLACRIRSRIIYKDCFIHLVGRYNVFRRMHVSQEFDIPHATDVIESLPIDVRERVSNKYYTAFTDACRYIEGTIIQYYPPALYRAEEVGRKDYSNDIFLEKALNLFRHWFGMQLVQGRNHASADDSGWSFYLQLLNGQYLDRDDLVIWHQKFPMSLKGSGVLQNHVNDIKQAVRGMVKDIFTNESQLMDDSPVRQWLTFTQVDDGDYPWDTTNDSDEVSEDDETAVSPKDEQY